MCLSIANSKQTIDSSRLLPIFNIHGPQVWLGDRALCLLLSLPRSEHQLNLTSPDIP